MLKHKRIINLALVVMLLITIIPASLALDNDVTGETALSMEDIQSVLQGYFVQSGIDIAIGTEAFYDYVLAQLLSAADKELSQHPQYDLIHAFLAYYKVYVEENYLLAPDSSSRDTRQLKQNLYTPDQDFFSTTIGQLIETYSIESDVTYTPITARAYSGYNASLAVNYARRFAYDRNVIYPYYLLGDCANFASQCLEAGLIGKNSPSPYPAGTYETTNYWYSYSSNNSTSWIRVSDFNTYWSARVTTASIGILSSLATSSKPGDIVLLTDRLTSVPYHTIIVTGTTAYDIYYCAHTTDRLDASLEITLGSDLSYKGFKLFKFAS